jgi:MioC protein
MKIVILFGTESGTAEFVAGDLADKLNSSAEVTVSDLAEFPVSAFSRDAFYVLICSTYGEGGPPASARPFLAMLEREAPDLSGIRYAVFGMGDSSYVETYSRGSEIVSGRLEALGAERVGEYGRHDASSRDHPSDLALEWIARIMPVAMLATAQEP